MLRMAIREPAAIMDAMFGQIAHLGTQVQQMLHGAWIPSQGWTWMRRSGSRMRDVNIDRVQEHRRQSMTWHDGRSTFDPQQCDLTGDLGSFERAPDKATAAQYLRIRHLFRQRGRTRHTSPIRSEGGKGLVQGVPVPAL